MSYLVHIQANRLWLNHSDCSAAWIDLFPDEENPDGTVVDVDEIDLAAARHQDVCKAATS